MRSTAWIVAGLLAVSIGVVGWGNLPPELTQIGPLVAEEGRSFPSLEMSRMVSDPDHADGELTWSFEEHEKLRVAMVGGRINIRARDPEWSGTTTLLFRVCDPEGACAEGEVQLSITPINDAPSLLIPDVVLREGEPFPTIDLAQYVTDPDHGFDELSWEISSDLDLEIELDRGVASIRPPDEEWLGMETVKFSVSDPEGACTDQTVIIARAPSTVSVTFVGNAGYIIDDGTTRIAIDALLSYGIGADVQQRMMQGEQPFVSIDLILVTHAHADHFHADCVVGQMIVDPAAILIAPSDVVRQVRAVAPEFGEERFISVELAAGEAVRIDAAGITIRAMDFPHSEARVPRNVGFLIELAEVSLLHPGDIVVEALGEAIDQHPAAELAVDLAFLPYFNLSDARYEAFVESIFATYVVPTHVGSSELDYVCGEASRSYEQSLCFLFPLQQRIVPVF